MADDLLARAQDYLLPPLRGVIAAKRRQPLSGFAYGRRGRMDSNFAAGRM